MYILVDGGEGGSRGMWSMGLEREQSPRGHVVGLWYHERLYGLKHCADLAWLVDDVIRHATHASAFPDPPTDPRRSRADVTVAKEVDERTADSTSKYTVNMV
ncbi:hypothetical protein HK405_002869, partial [Cladochytrium tenue]